MPLNSAQRRAFGTAGGATPRLPSQRQTRHKQRTHDVLPKPDKLISYRQLFVKREPLKSTSVPSLPKGVALNLWAEDLPI